jgi:serine protease Do
MNSIKVDQEVLTMGFPLGSIMGSKSWLFSGRINGVYGIQKDTRIFQIGNFIQPGNKKDS